MVVLKELIKCCYPKYNNADISIVIYVVSYTPPKWHKVLLYSFKCPHHISRKHTAPWPFLFCHHHEPHFTEIGFYWFTYISISAPFVGLETPWVRSCDNKYLPDANLIYWLDTFRKQISVDRLANGISYMPLWKWKGPLQTFIQSM